MTVLWLLALAAADVGGPAAKVKRLLTDVQETVTKNAADETIVLSALETFHQQLESSLSKEVQALKSTLGTLQNAQTDEITQVQSEEKELRQLHDAADGNTAIASNYEEGTKRVADKFGGVLMSMKALIALLKTSVVTPDGVLVTQEEPDENGGASRVLQAVNRVLASHKDMVSPGLYY
jgi:beta-lactamase superfamily II metal-dependent hydrolase